MCQLVMVTESRFLPIIADDFGDTILDVVQCFRCLFVHIAWCNVICDVRGRM